MLERVNKGLRRLSLHRIGRAVQTDPWSGVPAIIAFLAVMVAVGAACGGDDAADTGASSTLAGDLPGEGSAGDADPWPPYGVPADPWDDVVTPDCAPSGLPGPYTVGVRRFEIDGVAAEIWYPSDVDPGDRPRWDYYDMRTWLPERERDKIPDDEVPLFITRALRDVPVAEEGVFPLLLFSHGFAAFRYQSTYWTNHAASHGYVVAAIDHNGRALPTLLSFRQSGPNRTVIQLLDAIEELVADASDPLHGRIDFGRVAVSGHSAGGNEAAQALRDERIRAGVLFTPAGTPEPGTRDTEALVIAGSRDRITAPESVRMVYEGLEGVRWWLNIRDAGHLAFSDLCIIGRDDGGLVGVASRYGITNASTFEQLATDGCTDEDTPAEETWALQRHAGMAFLADALELPGAAALALGPIAECFGDLVLEAEGPIGPEPPPASDASEPDASGPASAGSSGSAGSVPAAPSSSEDPSDAGSERPSADEGATEPSDDE